jgi:hypothetical protein
LSGGLAKKVARKSWRGNLAGAIAGTSDGAENRRLLTLERAGQKEGARQRRKEKRKITAKSIF